MIGLCFFSLWLIAAIPIVHGFVLDNNVINGRNRRDAGSFGIERAVRASPLGIMAALATPPASPPLIFNRYSDRRRRSILAASSFLGGLFGGGAKKNIAVAKNTSNTNNIIKTENGMRYKRLGKSEVIVSELGLGTQRWVSTDYNAPDATTCFAMLDYAIIQHGANLIDTAEQYPIPSDGITCREGDSERLIGQWLAARRESVRRDDVVIATKITGGRNITPLNIQKDCEGSLRRLGTDYIDVYQLHWPQRYSPQSNWGQSLQYHVERENDPYWRANGGPTSFVDLCTSMEQLIQQGKIRSWGLCNDNAYGLTACCMTANMLGTTPPCSMQGDFSLLDRKSEENGVAEAASPYNENVGFMSYNALAGGMLTGKYLDVPAAMDDLVVVGGDNTNKNRALQSLEQPRGRMDTRGWGQTLYRYRSAAALAAVREYNDIVQKYQLSSLTELSLRWCRQRSLVTTTLVGHSNLSQLQQVVSCFTKKEPLSNEIMWDIDRVHMKNRLPIFSNDHVGQDWAGSGEIGETIP
jgi:aryl-alcohol dehydrogenase-like predicted oxidoreductase